MASVPTKRCAECGARVSIDAALCPTCGSQLHGETDSERCPDCGARVSVTDYHCPICGAHRRRPPQSFAGRLSRLSISLILLAATVALGWWMRPWEWVDLVAGLMATPSLMTAVSASVTPSSEVAGAPGASATPLPSAGSPSATRSATPQPQPSFTPSPVRTLTLIPTVIPSVTALVSPTASRVVHVVVAGDNLSRIAQQYGVSTGMIVEANGIGTDTVLSIGRELVIPAAKVSDTPESMLTPTLAPSTTATASSTPTLRPSPTAKAPTETATVVPTPTASPVTHRVAAGEHMGIIARQYGLPMAVIAEANRISVDSILSVGQELIIPGPTPSPGPATAAPEATPSSSSTPSATPSVRPTETTTLVPTATVTPAKETESPSVTATIVEPTATVRIHVVQSGEHLGIIGREYGLPEDTLAEANEISVDSILRIGQELIIPAPTRTLTPTVADTVTSPATAVSVPSTTIPTTLASASVTAAGASAVMTEAVTQTPTLAGTLAPVIHVVVEGDILGLIAVKYDVASERIAEANNISLRSVLQVGQELIIPDLEPTPLTPPTETPRPPTPSLPAVLQQATQSTQRTATAEALSPTRTPVPQLAYDQPHLLAPINGSVIEGILPSPLLNWSSAGILKSDEWYAVQIWQGQGEEPIAAYTRATSYRLGAELRSEEVDALRVQWQVVVVQRDAEGSTNVAQSAPSERYTFLWR